MIKHEVHHYPTMHPYKETGKKSDAYFVFEQLEKVPVSEQEQVSDTYERLYRRGGRAEANNWLKERCK
jgi:hypothetical protein